MIKPAVSRRMLLPVAFAALFVLAGCGIKGPLELPTEAQVNAKEAKLAKGKGRVPVERRLPGYQPNREQTRDARQLGRPVKPDTPFFLDPLLK